MNDMIHLEKIINGLREMSCRATWKDIDRIRHKFQPIINGAIDLLKEQESVAPIHPTDGSDLWRCGNCNHQLFRVTHQRYCSECGRKVKWDE